MLILIPKGEALVGEAEADNEIGDFGRFIKSSFCKIKPLPDGDVSSLTGDLSSCDEDDDRSDDGFLRQTSR